MGGERSENYSDREAEHKLRVGGTFCLLNSGVVRTQHCPYKLTFINKKFKFGKKLHDFVNLANRVEENTELGKQIFNFATFDEFCKAAVKMEICL